MSLAASSADCRIFRHAVEDVIFHEPAHGGVDRPTGGSETAKDLGALFVPIQGFEYRAPKNRH
jgi:hypothetical protein